MAFEPDIIVTGPESSDIELVVATKTFLPPNSDAERQLKRYMGKERASVGLLVTPKRLLLYADQYLPSEEESIVKAGDFDVEDVLRFQATGNPRVDGPAFEQHVQDWLERLASEAEIRRLPPDLRRVALLYIVPAVTRGSVRAGHPRYRVAV